MFGLSLTKPHQDSSQDPPGFSVSVWSAGGHDPKTSGDGGWGGGGLKVFCQCWSFVVMNILVKCATGRNSFKVPLRIDSFFCSRLISFFDFDVPFQVTIGQLRLSWRGGRNGLEGRTIT